MFDGKIFGRSALTFSAAMVAFTASVWLSASAASTDPTPAPAASAPAAAASAPASMSSAPAGGTSPGPKPSGNDGIAQFDTEKAAQAYCGKAEITWLNLRNKHYYDSRSVWWGKAKRGAFVCLHDAIAAGDTPAPFISPGEKGQF